MPSDRVAVCLVRRPWKCYSSRPRILSLTWYECPPIRTRAHRFCRFPLSMGRASPPSAVRAGKPAAGSSPGPRRSIAAAADDARRDGRARLGRGRRGVRHRRRVRRSSELRHGPAGPAAGERRLSRGHSQPARLALVRRLADVRPAAAVLRHQRGQHGLDDQPLHGQSQGPQRRRLQPRRADRPAARSGHVGLLPAGARGLSRACRSSPAASRPACGGSPITTIGATRSAARSCWIARPTCWSTAWASGRSSRSPTGWRPADRCATCATCAAWPIGWGPANRRRARARSSCPATSRSSTDKWAFAEMTKISHNETNPYNARRLVQYHDRECVVVNPPALPLSQAEMDRVYGLPFTRRPHPAYGERKIPAYEVVKDSVQIMRGCFGGCTFCSITAHEGRIIQSRSQRVGARRNPPDDGRSRLQRRDQRHRRPDGQHVSDALQPARGRSQMPPAELRASDDLQTAGDRPRAAGRN